MHETIAIKCFNLLRPITRTMVILYVFANDSKRSVLSKNLITWCYNENQQLFNWQLQKRVEFQMCGWHVSQHVFVTMTVDSDYRIHIVLAEILMYFVVHFILIHIISNIIRLVKINSVLKMSVCECHLRIFRTTSPRVSKERTKLLKISARWSCIYLTDVCVKLATKPSKYMWEQTSSSVL